MIRVSLTCMYCGHFWKSESWAMSGIRKQCPICKEKKQIKVTKTLDVFGYDNKNTIDLEDQLKFGDDDT